MKIFGERSVSVAWANCVAAILTGFMVYSLFSQNHSFKTWCGVVILSALLTLFSCVGKKNMVSDHIYRYCLVIFVVTAGSLQLITINELRFVPSFDLDAIYGGAIAWVETGSFRDYYDYFDWFSNNLGGLCLLYFVFKVGSIFSSDYFVMAACFNTVLLLAALILTSLTARKLWGNRCGILTLILLLCMPPLFFMPDAFYTDSLSVLFPIGLLYLSLRTEGSKGWDLLKLCVISGFVAAVGSLVKPTVLIMAIAVSLSFLFQKKWKRFVVYSLSVGSVCLMVTLLFRGYIYGNHLDPELAEVKNTPSYHWVMMGLNGNGAYNPEDYEFTRLFTDPEIRDAALRDEIKNRIAQKGISGMAALYVAKLFRCFGDGTLGISDFLDDNPYERTRIHEYILYDGSNYASYQILCNIAFYTFLLFMFLLMVMEIMKMKSGKHRQKAGVFSAVLAMAGITVFLMHWETSSRYITNYVPVLLVLAAGGIGHLGKWVAERRGLERK